jgi:hypothetical protein
VLLSPSARERVPPLKLRASVDLTKVGQDKIKSTPHSLEKFEPKK